MNWTAITSAVTVVTAVGALIFTGLSLNATRDQVGIAQAQNAVAEQGQVTDRYSKAVEQIGQRGDDHLQVRLGGVYALERLARDSPRDQPTIIEVLSAFVRTSVETPVEAQGPGAACPQRPVAPDVQAALTVLGRRDATHDGNAHIDLANTCLDKVDLTGANLVGANLVRTHMSGAAMEFADLRDAVLTRANLAGAKLSGANLLNARLLRVDLSKAALGEARLENANLIEALLQGASLYAAHLNGALLSGADLSRADFSGADLTDVDHLRAVTVETHKDQATIGAWW
ncbi:pentapeptide repeat protein [Actinocrispum wychmicini]|uniref:Pentapeptide repeat protein n=1 Tax=Actinocrispum wychmicini TaxID=1213861 RepID=A0A4R2JBM6_9PSEU|nr:pentapeptide repeat protein [Actinocrispum wychmicini]